MAPRIVMGKSLQGTHRDSLRRQGGKQQVETY